MYQHALNFIGIVLLAALLAAGAIIGNAMRIDKDPAIDGPRALVAEFFGLWIAFVCLAWSFMLPGPATLLWILRGIAGTAAAVGLLMAAYFAGTPEVRVDLSEEPTGFERPVTTLQLNEVEAPAFDEVSSSRRTRDWSELNTQN